MSKFRKEIASINVFYDGYDNVGVFCINGYYKSALRHVYMYKTYISKESFFTVLRNLFKTRGTSELQISVGAMPVGCDDIRLEYDLFGAEQLSTKGGVVTHSNSKELLEYIREEFYNNGIEIILTDDFFANLRLLKPGEQLLKDL